MFILGSAAAWIPNVKWVIWETFWEIVMKHLPSIALDCNGISFLYECFVLNLFECLESLMKYILFGKFQRNKIKYFT